MQEKEVQTGVQVAPADGDETIEGFLRGGGRVVERAFLARVGVSEVLKGRAV